MERASTAAAVLCLMTYAVGISVLDCSGNLDATTVSGVTFDGSGITSPAPFTVCLRFQFEKLRPLNVLVNAQESSGRPMLQLQVNVDRFRIIVAHEYRYVVLQSWILPRQWYHVCVTRTGTEVEFFLDSKRLASHTLVMNVVGKASELTVGFLNPKIYPGLTFIGNVTQVNVWGRKLEQKDISEMSMCVKDHAGDIITWGQNWTSVNSRTVQVDLHSLCQNESTSKIEILPAMSFLESTYVCEGLGGSLATPPSRGMVRRLIESARSRTDSGCNLFWSGIWDDMEEGKWTNHFTGVEMVDVPWAPDEPNGMHFENCGGLDGDGFADDDCQRKRCGLCEVVVGRPWVLRGACLESPHDRGFLLREQTSPSRAVGDFVGFGDFVIVRDEDETWRWRDAKSGRVLAALQSAKYNYPIGRHWWHLNTPMCGQLEGVRQLALTSCPAGHYTCDDATCVPLVARCDLQFDCRDHSDEAHCRVVELVEDYQASVSPRDADGRHRITAAIELETVHVSTRTMLVATTFNLTLTWHDSRATFHDLKRDHTRNVLPSNGTLWSPSIAFVNTLDHSGTVADDRAVVYGRRVRRSPGVDDSFPGEIELYPGSENSITSHRQYQTSFTCDFDLSLYPFDQQSCFLLLELRKNAFGYFDAEASSVKYDGIAVLLEYQVGKVVLKVEDDAAVLKVEIPLARRHGYAFITVYLPSLTMLLISFLTLFFPCQFFDTRVMTSLTTILVMATLSSQVAASLPNTSYFKMADVWLLFCIFSSFLVIVFHVLVERSAGLPHNQTMDAKTCNLEFSYGHRNPRPFRRTSKANSETAEAETKANPREAWRHVGTNSCRLTSKQTWTWNAGSGSCQQRMSMFSKLMFLLVFILFNSAYWGSIVTQYNSTHASA